MASRYFIPQSGDYAWDGAVWAATPTGAAGSAATPVNGDDVYILSGTARIISSLNQSAVTLGSLTVGFNGELGTSSASFQIACATGFNVHISGGGTLRMAITGTNVSANVYDDFSGSLYITGGTLLSLYCGQYGQAFITSTVSEVVSCGCGITINSGASVAALVCTAGNHLSNASLTAVDVTGRANLTVQGQTPAVSGYIYLSGLSVLRWDSQGTINGLVLYTGAEARAVGTYGGFTVTTSTQYAGSKMFENPSVPIIYTNATTKIGIR